MSIARALVVVTATMSMWHCNSAPTAAPKAQGAQEPRTTTAPRPRGRSTIRGSVTTIEGQPLAGVTIIAGAAGSATTGADGRYEVRDLPGGRYQVYASKSEFVPWRYRQKHLDDRDTAEVEIRDDQIVEHIDITLPRGAVVTGRVSDNSGRPVTGARVMLAKAFFEHGTRSLIPMWMWAPRAGVSASTNERGEYRLFGVPAGTYFIVVSPLDLSATRADDQGRRVAFANTLYPSTTELSAASSLLLRFEEVRTDVNITLSAVQVFKVSGVVVDAMGRRAIGGRVQAMPRGALSNGGFGFGLAAEASIQRDGRFVLNDLRAGRYSVRALLPEPRAGSVAARIAAWLEHTASAVVVDSGDVGDLRLASASLVSVRGRVIFDDESAARSIAPSDVCVVPFPWDFDDGWVGIGELAAEPARTRTGADYTFEWTTLPGHLAVRAGLCASMSDELATWHVKNVRANSRDVSDAGLEIGADGLGDVEVVLTAGQPLLTGVVRDASGAAEINRVVIVFAQEPARWTVPNNRYFSVSFTDAEGRFRATVPPGDYFVVAVDRGSISEWPDPDFLGPLVPKAARLSLARSEKRTIDLVLDNASIDQSLTR